MTQSSVLLLATCLILSWSLATKAKTSEDYECFGPDGKPFSGLQIITDGCLAEEVSYSFCRRGRNAENSIMSIQLSFLLASFNTSEYQLPEVSVQPFMLSTMPCGAFARQLIEIPLKNREPERFEVKLLSGRKYYDIVIPAWISSNSDSKEEFWEHPWSLIYGYVVEKGLDAAIIRVQALVNHRPAVNSKVKIEFEHAGSISKSSTECDKIWCKFDIKKFVQLEMNITKSWAKIDYYFSPERLTDHSPQRGNLLDLQKLLTNRIISSIKFTKETLALPKAINSDVSERYLSTALMILLAPISLLIIGYVLNTVFKHLRDHKRAANSKYSRILIVVQSEGLLINLRNEINQHIRSSKLPDCCNISWRSLEVLDTQWLRMAATRQNRVFVLVSSSSETGIPPDLTQLIQTDWSKFRVLTSSQAFELVPRLLVELERFLGGHQGLEWV